MKTYERREAGTETFYKLATWDARSFTWRDGKVAYETEGDAYGAAAGRKGKFRVSVVTGRNRTDLTAFES